MEDGELDTLIQNLHKQMKKVYEEHGIETYVSMKVPNNRKVYQLVNAKKSTLQKIQIYIDKKLKR